MARFFEGTLREVNAKWEVKNQCGSSELSLQSEIEIDMGGGWFDAKMISDDQGVAFISEEDGARLVIRPGTKARVEI